VARRTVAASKPAVGVVALHRGIAAAVVGHALIDVYAAALGVGLVAKRAITAGEAAGRVGTGHQLVAAAVVGRAFIDIDTLSCLLRVTAGAVTAIETASGVRALGQRIAATVLARALVDVGAQTAVAERVDVTIATFAVWWRAHHAAGFRRTHDVPARGLEGAAASARSA
jgi:hypothetical protein